MIQPPLIYEYVKLGLYLEIQEGDEKLRTKSFCDYTVAKCVTGLTP